MCQKFTLVQSKKTAGLCRAAAEVYVTAVRKLARRGLDFVGSAFELERREGGFDVKELGKRDAYPESEAMAEAAAVLGDIAEDLEGMGVMKI